MDDIDIADRVDVYQPRDDEASFGLDNLIRFAVITLADVNYPVTLVDKDTVVDEAMFSAVIANNPGPPDESAFAPGLASGRMRKTGFFFMDCVLPLFE
jgi:hypothetical protein